MDSAFDRMAILSNRVCKSVLVLAFWKQEASFDSPMKSINYFYNIRSSTNEDATTPTAVMEFPPH